MELTLEEQLKKLKLQEKVISLQKIAPHETFADFEDFKLELAKLSKDDQILFLKSLFNSEFRGGIFIQDLYKVMIEGMKEMQKLSSSLKEGYLTVVHKSRLAGCTSKGYEVAQNLPTLMLKMSEKKAMAFIEECKKYFNNSFKSYHNLAEVFEEKAKKYMKKLKK